MSKPLDLSVSFDLSLDTEVSNTYRQTSEDCYAAHPLTVLDLVVDTAARQLVDKIIRDATDYQGFKGMVRERLAKRIDDAITPMLDEAIATPVQMTNGYGEPTGQNTTLRELVVKSARDVMNKRVDSYGSRESVLDKALKEVAEKVVAAELKSEIDDAKAKVRAALKDSAASVLAAAMAKQVGA